jgi:hypothetical protein
MTYTIEYIQPATPTGTQTVTGRSLVKAYAIYDTCIDKGIQVVRFVNSKGSDLRDREPIETAV